MQEILGYAQTAVSAATMAAVFGLAILAKIYLERLIKRMETMLGGSVEPAPDKPTRYQYIGGDVTVTRHGQYDREIETGKGVAMTMPLAVFNAVFKEVE